MKYLLKITTIICLLAVFNSCKNEPKKQDPATDNSLLPDTLPREIMPSEEEVNLTEKIKNNPNDGELYYQRAQVFVNHGNLDKAVFDIEKAVELSPDNKLYWLKLGEISFMANKLQRAEEAYNKAIALDKDYEEAYYALGNFHYMMRAYDKSNETLDKLLLLNPNNAKAYYLKGRNYTESNDSAKAVNNFLKAVKINNDDIDAYTMLARFYANKNSLKAIDYFDNALRINPKSTEILYAKGLLYQQKGMNKDAVIQYNKMIDIDPTNTLPYYNIGYINFQMENRPVAIEAFSKCIAMNNQYFEAFYMRGLCFEMDRKILEAMEDYKRALTINPDYELAKEGYLRIDKRRINPKQKK